MEEMIKEILVTVKNIEKRLDAIEERMDRIEARMDNIEARMDNIEARMDNIEARMDKFDERQNEFNNRQNRFEERLDQIHNETVMEIRELAESISKIMNKKYDELLSKIDETIKNNQIDHKIYEAKLKKLEAGQEYLESKVEKAVVQKVG